MIYGWISVLYSRLTHNHPQLSIIGVIAVPYQNIRRLESAAGPAHRSLVGACRCYAWPDHLPGFGALAAGDCWVSYMFSWMGLMDVVRASSRAVAAARIYVRARLEALGMKGKRRVRHILL